MNGYIQVAFSWLIGFAAAHPLLAGMIGTTLCHLIASEIGPLEAWLSSTSWGPHVLQLLAGFGWPLRSIAAALMGLIKNLFGGDGGGSVASKDVPPAPKASPPGTFRVPLARESGRRGIESQLEAAAWTSGVVFAAFAAIMIALAAFAAGGCKALQSPVVQKDAGEIAKCVLPKLAEGESPEQTAIECGTELLVVSAIASGESTSTRIRAERFAAKPCSSGGAP